MCEDRFFSLMARNHNFFSIAMRIGQEMLLLTSKVAIRSSLIPNTFLKGACFSAQASQCFVFQE